MRYTENTINIITMKEYKGIGRAWVVKNIKGNESVDEIVKLLNTKSKQEYEITTNNFDMKRNEILIKIESLGESCDGIVAIGDKDFPKCRGNVKESEQPIFIFYKGDLSLLDLGNNNVTVIGLLNPDESIELRERKIVSELVKHEITVVSGLALGCDSISHREALNSGKTIAILPSSLDNIIPSANRQLAFDIVEEGGLLITEYFEKHKSSMDLNGRYKDRDRLQALYCDAIILVASYAQDSAKKWNIFGKKLDSGARLAMNFAKEYNIPRAIMYNKDIDLNNPMFDLNRQLIGEQSEVIVLSKKSLNELISNLKLGNFNNSKMYQSQLF